MRTDLFLFLTLSLAAITSCDEASGDRYDPSTYKNPVTTQKMPDPTVIRDGTDWLLYHAYWVNSPSSRTLMLDRVNWTDGWPLVNDGYPSNQAASPRL